MSAIRAQLTADMKEAMKAKDAVKLEAIRGLQSAIKYKEVELRPNEISDDDILGVVKKLIKQRKESIEQFQAAGRQDLVDKETRELQVLEAYMPAQMGKEQVEALVLQVITETGASSVKDMGRVMKEVLAKSGGAADNRMVSEIVKTKLT